MDKETFIRPEGHPLESKVQRMQKQISLYYWFGWSGIYNRSKKKI